MKVLKIIGLTCGIILVIILVVTAYFLYYGETELPAVIGILHQNVTDSKITLNGQLFESAKAYRGYSVRYSNGVLYVNIRSSLAVDLPPNLTSSGYFSISIPNKYGKIQQIYLEGKNPSQNKLIWPENPNLPQK